MTFSIIRGLSVAVVILVAACGGDSGTEQTLPDLAHNNTGSDLSSNIDGGTPDLVSTGCAQPSDTCVMNPTTHEQLINGCVAGDVVKVDITPFYPTQGYTNCALPTL